MICQICGKHTASMLVQQIVDGKKKEIYICRACAKKHNLFTDKRKMHSSLKMLFDELLPQLSGTEGERKTGRVTVCPNCGTPLSRIKEKKSIGCPLCFFYFRDTILTFMREVNGEVFYAGNVPAQLEIFSGGGIPLQQLESELKKALENEEYELAAYLRDKIKEREASS